MVEMAAACRATSRSPSGSAPEEDAADPRHRPRAILRQPHERFVLTQLDGAADERLDRLLRGRMLLLLSKSEVGPFEHLKTAEH